MKLLHPTRADRLGQAAGGGGEHKQLGQPGPVGDILEDSKVEVPVLLIAIVILLGIVVVNHVARIDLDRPLLGVIVRPEIYNEN